MQIIHFCASTAVVLISCAFIATGLETENVNPDESLTVLIDFKKYQELSNATITKMCADAEQEEYKNCGNKCVLSCQSSASQLGIILSEKDCVNSTCIEGCFCKDGLVRHQNKCIAAKDCPIRNDRAIGFLAVGQVPFPKIFGVLSRQGNCGLTGCTTLPVQIDNHNEASDGVKQDRNRHRGSGREEEHEGSPIHIHVQGIGIGNEKIETVEGSDGNSSLDGENDHSNNNDDNKNPVTREGDHNRKNHHYQREWSGAQAYEHCLKACTGSFPGLPNVLDSMRQIGYPTVTTNIDGTNMVDYGNGLTVTYNPLTRTRTVTIPGLAGAYVFDETGSVMSNLKLPSNLAGDPVEGTEFEGQFEPELQNNVNFEPEQQDDADNKNQRENNKKIPSQMQSSEYMQNQNTAAYQNQLMQYPYPNQYQYQYLTIPNPNIPSFNSPAGISGSYPFNYYSMAPTNSESSSTMVNELPKKDISHKHKHKNSSKKPPKESNRGVSAHSSSKPQSEDIAQKQNSQHVSNRDKNSSIKPPNKTPTTTLIPSPQYSVQPIDQAAYFNYLNTYNPNQNIFHLTNFNGGNGYSSQFTQPNQFNLYSSLVNRPNSNNIPNSNIPMVSQNTIAYPYVMPYKSYDASFPYYGNVPNQFSGEVISSDTNSRLSDTETYHDEPKKEVVHIRGYKKKYIH